MKDWKEREREGREKEREYQSEGNDGIGQTEGGEWVHWIT